MENKKSSAGDRGPIPGYRNRAGLNAFRNRYSVHASPVLRLIISMPSSLRQNVTLHHVGRLRRAARRASRASRSCSPCRDRGFRVGAQRVPTRARCGSTRWRATYFASSQRLPSTLPRGCNAVWWRASIPTFSWSCLEPENTVPSAASDGRRCERLPTSGRCGAAHPRNKRCRQARLWQERPDRGPSPAGPAIDRPNQTGRGGGW